MEDIDVVLHYLEVEKIIGDKVAQERRLFLVKWKGQDYKTWVHISILKSSFNLLLQYYAEVIGTIDCKCPDLNGLQKVDRIIKLMGEATDSEINEIVANYLTIVGLNLPASRSDALIEKLLDLVKNHVVPNLKQTKQIRDAILVEKILFLREQQLSTLKRTEYQINLICDNEKSITIENNVDLEILPKDFVYVNNYKPGNGVAIPTDPPIGCDCSASGGCSYVKKKFQSGCCCPNISDTHPAYDANKRLMLKKRAPIYECNKKCSCDRSCPNRVVQNGSNLRLEIFRTFNDCGWGVRTLEYIPSGTFVARYVGEVITYEEAETRSKEYLFDLDFNYATVTDICPYTVDAIKYGNITRFINHSCDPNLQVFGVLTDCLDPDFHEIAFFTNRDVAAGEELCFNYRKLMKCKCGSINCKLK